MGKPNALGYEQNLLTDDRRLTTDEHVRRPMALGYLSD